jgi:hypothetical protein
MPPTPLKDKRNSGFQVTASCAHLGKAAVYLADHEDGPGPVLQELIAKIQKAAAT